MNDKPSDHNQANNVPFKSDLNEQQLRTHLQQIAYRAKQLNALYNPDFKATPRRPDQFTPSAVLLPVINRAELSFLFTHRADHLPNHAGEVSFPGGKMEETDDSLITTALRETEEELGIPADTIEILAELPPLQVLSGFAIKPVIGLIQPPFPIECNENEVQGVFEAPLYHCLNTTNFSYQEAIYQGENRAFFALQWNKWNIWGATAAILHGLSDLIAQAIPQQ